MKKLSNLLKFLTRETNGSVIIIQADWTMTSKSVVLLRVIYFEQGEFKIHSFTTGHMFSFNHLVFFLTRNTYKTMVSKFHVVYQCSIPPQNTWSWRKNMPDVALVLISIRSISVVFPSSRSS